MRLRGERAVARARAVVESFAPLPRASRARDAHWVVTGFGAFPGNARNATAEIVRALGAANGIALARRSFRSRDFAVGRGSIALSSGRAISVSLMVLPVVWEAAAALVAKEARATRASGVVMSGIAAPEQPLLVETRATGARITMRDHFGVRPARALKPHAPRAMTIDLERAHAVAREMITRETIAKALRGAEQRTAAADNAYVCNATAHVIAGLATRSRSVLRSSAAPNGTRVERFAADYGFIHWPSAIEAGEIAACAKLLLAIVEAI